MKKFNDMINEYQTASSEWSDEVDKFDINMAKLHSIIEKVSNKQQFDLENRGLSAALRFTNEELQRIINDLEVISKTKNVS